MKAKKQEVLSLAISLAAQIHHGQFDKGGNPYILHCLTVMNNTQSTDPYVKAAAVLHDIIEDGVYTNTDGHVVRVSKQWLIDQGIPLEVVLLVEILSKKEGQTYEEYQAGIFSNPSAMLIKASDLQHNSDIRRLKGVRPKDFERVAKYMQFYDEIQARLKS